MRVRTVVVQSHCTDTFVGGASWTLAK